MKNSINLVEILGKIENILTHWSVPQAGSNKEKKKRKSKISLDYPISYPSICTIVHIQYVYQYKYIQMGPPMHKESKNNLK